MAGGVEVLAVHERLHGGGDGRRSRAVGAVYRPTWTGAGRVYRMARGTAQTIACGCSWSFARWSRTHSVGRKRDLTATIQAQAGAMGSSETVSKDRLN